MVTVTSNIVSLTDEIREKLKALGSPEVMPRILAFDVIDLMTKRIHIEGKAADDGQIGTYTASYLKLREKKYNRKADDKIIVSLTRQLEQDWSVLDTPNGYGVGFKNTFNYQKARWVEENKNRDIFSLSQREQNYVTEVITELVENALK